MWVGRQLLVPAPLLICSYAGYPTYLDQFNCPVTHRSGSGTIQAMLRATLQAKVYYHPILQKRELRELRDLPKVSQSLDGRHSTQRQGSVRLTCRNPEPVSHLQLGTP